MKDAAISILLALLVEAIGAVAAYLKNRLIANVHRSAEGIWQDHSEFA